MKVNAATRQKLIDIGETIREARERAGVSQAALAAKIGMLRENVIRAEKGRVNLTVETLTRFADGLEVDLVVKFGRGSGSGGATRKPPAKRASR